MDLDFGLNNLDVLCGVENKVVYDIKDVIDGRCRVKQTVIDLSPTLAIVPSRNTFDKEITAKNVQSIAEGLSTKYDFVLLDCPAGIDNGFHRAASVADEAIIVVAPSLTSLRDGDKVLSLLKNYSIKKVGIIVNRARGDLILSGDALSCAEVEEILKTPVVGCIPDDDLVLLDKNYQLSGARAEKAFKLAAAYLKKGKGKVYDPTLYYRGFWGGLRRSLRSLV